MMFHTDIARDFLLIEDIIATKNPTLIGPKAGGIPGMFFGPVWLYIHIPLFLIGSGNPIVIAYFWVFLVLLSVVSVYFITSKIFNKTSAVIASLIYSFFAVTFSTGFTQSFGSVLITPWLVYFMFRYFEKVKTQSLVIALLINGFIYQLQPAVGMITLPVTLFLSLGFILKKKRYKDLWSYFILLIPFSTYIYFELRHDFLEVRAFIDHFVGTGSPKGERLNAIEFIKNRVDSYLSIIDLVKNGLVSHGAFLILYFFIIFKIIKKQTFEGKRYYLLFFAYILGFVGITLLYKGILIDYYFWAFLPLSVIAFAGLYRTIPRVVFAAFAIIILYTAINAAVSYRNWWENSFTGKDSSSWRLNKEAAEFIFADSEGDFGYFVYSPDEFGYSARYAMNFTQKMNGNIGKLCEKEKTMYLIYYPTPEHAKTDPVYWKEVRVNIQKDPLFRRVINDITIEKYILSEKEQNVPSDPHIVCNLHFR
ncbi:MAG: hypothetical protein QG600_695 [Patescibacteria group bacterium]|nr:hypothetical protein [Patescibacteria group bacterium]